MSAAPVHGWLEPRKLVPLLVALAAPALAWAGPAAKQRRGDAATEAGLRIYRDGTLPGGRPLRASAQSGTARTGADAACAGCHRRSGFGTSEGPIAIPSVTASALFGWSEAAPPRPAPVAARGMAPANRAVAEQAGLLAARRARIASAQGARRRPPYDDASLARAIRDGVDVTGRPLGGGMPRYALGDREMKALLAYLRTLSTSPAPGVTAEELHLATVIEPGVDPARRRAVLEVLQAFVHDKNAGTRSEEQRRAAGIEREYRAYRTWVLHVWDVSGPAETWERQLEALYRRQPVFALVGGLGSSSWSPVHRFSERNGIPCLFPQADLPATEAGFYTVYLSRGLPLEAEALAKHLRGRKSRAGITQVFRRDEAGAAAAAAFRRAMPPGTDLEDRVLEGTASRGFWDRLARERPGSILVLWVRAGDLAEAGTLVERGPEGESIYLSSTLLGASRPDLAYDARARLVHPLDLPRMREARLLRVKRWLRERGIAVVDEQAQMNAYFAVAVTADAVTHMSDLFSREYLVERIEHMVGNTVTPSIYPRVSLGPDQRFASKGSFIVKLAGRGTDALEPVSEWVTP